MQPSSTLPPRVSVLRHCQGNCQNCSRPFCEWVGLEGESVLLRGHSPRESVKEISAGETRHWELVEEELQSLYGPKTLGFQARC